MRFSRNVVFAALICPAFLGSPTLAGNGKIAGVVTDQAGEPLPGANVITTVAGIPAGATTSAAGKYFILNIPPGEYIVQASFVGYGSVQKTAVKVRLDLTSTVDFALAPRTLEGEMVTVVAERPRVEKSLTATRSSIDIAELDNTMPVADVQELIDIAPSVYRGFIRGGRKSETKILIDGIDVSDTYFRAGEGRSTYQVYTGTNRTSGSEFTSVGINASSVQSLDIVSGTFNAEYDAASAGVINVITREGGDRISGRIFFRTSPSGTRNAGPDVYNDLDRYNGERDALLNSEDEADQAKGALYTFDRSAIDDVGYGDDRPYEAELSLGGPLTRKGNFFLTARFLNEHGHFPNELRRTARYSLKVAHSPHVNLKFTGHLMVDDGGKLGGWINRDFSGKFKYFPTGYTANKKLGLMGYVGFTHVLSPRTFYEIKVSQLNRSSEFGYADDDGNGVVERGEDGDFIVIDTPRESELYLGVGGTGVRADGTRSFFTTNPGNERFFDLIFSSNQYRFHS